MGRGEHPPPEPVSIQRLRQLATLVVRASITNIVLNNLTPSIERRAVRVQPLGCGAPGR